MRKPLELIALTLPTAQPWLKNSISLSMESRDEAERLLACARAYRFLFGGPGSGRLSEADAQRLIKAQEALRQWGASLTADEIEAVFAVQEHIVDRALIVEAEALFLKQHPDPGAGWWSLVALRDDLEALREIIATAMISDEDEASAYYEAVNFADDEMWAAFQSVHEGDWNSVQAALTPCPPPLRARLRAVAELGDDEAWWAPYEWAEVEEGALPVYPPVPNYLDDDDDDDDDFWGEE